MFRFEAQRRILNVGIVTIAAGFGCSDSTGTPGPEVPTDRAPGSLQLRCLGSCSTADEDKAAVGGSEREIRQHEQAQSDPAKFELGDLHASREFLFLLVNPGDTDVTDIVLSSSHPSFSIEPATIERLPPQKDAAILPVIRVLAEHGISLNGVGNVSLLPMGLNTTTLTISGTSMNDAGETASTDVSAALQVTARVMDVQLYDGDTVVDLAASPGSTSSTLGGLGFVNLYLMSTTDASLTNTGNVDIEVTVLQDTTPLFTSTLAVDSTLDLPHYDVPGVRLQSNTVADGSRFQIGNDGAAYFVLYPR